MPRQKIDRIARLNLVAIKHGGKCLSKVYVSAFSPLFFQCAKGHKWATKPNTIRQGSWCPICANNKPNLNLINDINIIAKTRGGICLSKKCINRAAKLSFICKENHKWKTNAGTILAGSWCPECSLNKDFLLKKYKKLAIENGGKCLSDKYVSVYSKLLFQCKKGHQFETTPNTIRKGSWCSKCNRGTKITIDDMHKLAKQFNCICLSKKYVLSKSPLKWECKKRVHRWTSSSSNFRTLKGCVQCKKIDGKRRY